MNRNLLGPIGITLLILLVLKLCQIFFPPSWLSILTPALLLYVPFIILWVTRSPIEFLDRSWMQFFFGIASFFVTILIVFPPYILLAHLWMIHVFGYSSFEMAPLEELTKHVGYHLLVVSIPEEFYFRGFLQDALNKVFRPKWRLLGVNLGWGWLATALIFAFAHSVIQLQWWHFSIFFPALLFGYLKERTGSITAPVLFHAFSNCFMNWFARSYF